MKAAGRAPKGAEFEKIRKWDAKHPQNSIGQYDQEVWDEVNKTKKGGQA